MFIKITRRTYFIFYVGPLFFSLHKIYAMHIEKEEENALFLPIFYTEHLRA
jgi:hypothetical protein